MTAEPKYRKPPSRAKTHHHPQQNNNHARNGKHFDYGFEDEEYYYEDYYQSFEPRRANYRPKRQPTEKHADARHAPNQTRLATVLDQRVRVSFKRDEILKLFCKVPLEQVFFIGTPAGAVVAKISQTPEAHSAFTLPISECQKAP